MRPAGLAVLYVVIWIDEVDWTGIGSQYGLSGATGKVNLRGQEWHEFHTRTI